MGERRRPREGATFSDTRVVAVVVAHNRRVLLSAALDALAAQNRPVDAILVVDNASSDGTGDLVRSHRAHPELLAVAENIGGAGGFAVGLQRAVSTMGAGLVWLMDDDTVPTPSALRELLNAWHRYPGRIQVACSRVVWTDGRDHPMNTPRRRPRASAAELQAARAAGALPVRSTSFVSMLVSAEAVREHGLPVADYFLWNDDFEYSCRLLRRGTGIRVPASVVEHRTARFGGSDADPGERFYFEVRNKIWMLTRSDALSAGERVLYAGASLRRWARTLVRSTRRGVLVRVGVRGLRDGLLTKPRPTDLVLREFGVRVVSHPASDDPTPVDDARVTAGAA